MCRAKKTTEAKVEKLGHSIQSTQSLTWHNKIKHANNTLRMQVEGD